MQSTQITRRRLVTAGAAILAGRAAKGANDRIRVGVIGTGNRGNLLIDQLPEEAEIVAVSDCFVTRCRQAAAKRQAKWRIYQDYRQLLEQKDIDGVIVATTDHVRVLPSMHACLAGKDVYAEKPLTAYIAEGRALVNAVRKTGRIFQVGSQQRSMMMNQIASKFVRGGGLGRIQFVLGANYTSPADYKGLPEEPVPEGLDWDVWQGPAPQRPYNKRLHLNWMGWRDYSGGDMTNWGAHGLDQIQMALGTDETGPVELWPVQDGPAGALAFKYENGVTVRLMMPSVGDVKGGGIFCGDKGRIEIIRNGFRTDPPQMIKELPPPGEVQKWRDEVALWQAKYHMQNWLDCMRSRRRPIADVEIGHRSISIAHLANITRLLGRKLRWNPQAESFVDDREANGYLTRRRRAGYELPKL